jgi:putative ABC transport system permease protein
MAANPVVAFALLLLVVVGAIAALLIVRHRLAFRLAMRNVRRGRTRTVLLVAGLLVATTIISGSLVVGDTVNQLSLHYSYLGAGYVDEAIYAPSASGGPVFFPYSVYQQTVSLTSSDPSIAEVVPEILTGGSAFDVQSRVPETNLNLIGVNGNQSTALGSFVADNGTSLAGPAPGEVLVDDQAASALNATAGQTLVVYGIKSAPLKIEAVVQDNVRGAIITAGLTPGNLFVTLPTARQLENVSGAINYIGITNTGSQDAGASSSTGVAQYLNTTLAAVLAPYGLTVHTPLESALNAARQSGTSLVTLFLALGLFSIVAGAVLIVGIFVMLAEERKGEMGMLRAIGLRRRELVYAFFFEGIVYSAGSALAGTALGVGVGYFLSYLAGQALAVEIPSAVFLQSFTVTTQSLVLAYVAGFLLTLVTVVVACYRASRLNIVRAIRDIPEPPPRLRTYTSLAYAGGVAAAVGLLLFFRTYRGSTDLSEPLIGGALAILGLGLVAARFLRNRFVFTAVGIAFAIWAGFEPLHGYLLGTAHTGGIFIVFVDGIILVGGVLLVFVFNAPSIAHVLERLIGRRAASSAVVRVGLGYPTRQPTRTAVSLTIFSLVVFTMVATAGFGSVVAANLNNTIEDQTGGYTFFGSSQTAIPNLWGKISSNSTLAPLFLNAVTIIPAAIDVNVTGFAHDPYSDELYAPLNNTSGPASFYATNHFTFSTTWQDMSAVRAFRDIATNDSVAIVDHSYAPATTAISGAPGGPPHPTLNVGDTFEISTLRGKHPLTLTVVGILKERSAPGIWVNPAVAASLGYVNATGYGLTVAPGVNPTHAAQLAKIAFLPWGLVLVNLASVLATSIGTTEGFVGLLEIFVGLGLAVGIAAMGILALRAVVERRREIGVLRATGFTQRMVLRTLALEYSFVTLAGIVIGTGLGLLVVFNLTQSASAAASGLTVFAVPWLTVAEIALVAYGLVLVAIAGPSLRASRQPPAEAVRATE